MSRSRTILRTLRRALPLLLLAALALLVFSACDTDTPTNTFDARGEVAQDQRDLFYFAMWPALVIMIGVLAAAVIIVLRFRRRSDSDPMPPQIHGNNRLELTWTILPAVMMLALGIPTVIGINELGRDPADDAFQVRAIGVQWLWIFEYPELTDASGEVVSTNNEMHIPTGREVSVTIVSEDVIHSFWVPKLAGKLDAIPGKENVMWMKTDEADSFKGQCVEFCGLEHANMEFTLIAQDEADFQAWQDEVTAGE
jgi:cytochrome c oxidase subunit 2